MIRIWEERETFFEEVLKIVIDIKNNQLAVDAEMHADLEQLLLKEGSVQQDLWGQISILSDQKRIKLNILH